MSRQGNSPKVTRTRFQAQSADPVNPQEGDVFRSDGTVRTEGLYEYRQGAWQLVAPRVQGLMQGDDASFDGSVGNWVAYADAAQNTPVDGTGGSPTLTVTRTTSTPLKGSGSLLLTKDSNNRQGEGGSVDLAVDPIYRGQPVKLSLSVEADSGYDFGDAADPVGSPSDLGFYFYDVTNSKLLSSNKVYIHANGVFEDLVQVPSNCSTLRLIAHVQTTSAVAWTFKADNFKLDLAPNTANPGNIHDSATLTGYSGLASGAVLFATTLKAPDRGILEIDTTSGFTKIVANVKCNVTASYSGDYGTTGATAPTLVWHDSTGTVKTITISTFVNANSDANSAATTVEMEPGDYFAVGSGVAFANNNVANFSVTATASQTAYSHVAQVGLNAKAVMRARKSGGSVTAAATVPNWDEVHDTTGSFNATTGIYTVKSPGDYKVDIIMTSGIGANMLSQIYLNGSIIAEGQDTGSPWSSTHTILPNLKYGDTIDVRSNTNQTLSAIYRNILSIHKIGSEQQPYAPRVAYLKDVKTGTGGSYTAGAYQTRILNTLDGDGSFVTLGNGTLGTDGTANQFTLQPGTYHIEATVPAYRVSNWKSKLRNITDTSDVLIGTTRYSNSAADYADSISHIVGTFTIDSTKTFEIQMRGQASQGANGLGSNTGFSDNEIFTQVKLTKVL